MIRDGEELQNFEDELVINEKADFERNYLIVEAMYREALDLGIIPLKNPLEGLEVCIKIARVINSVSSSY